MTTRLLFCPALIGVTLQGTGNKEYGYCGMYDVHFRIEHLTSNIINEGFNNAGW